MIVHFKFYEDIDIFFMVIGIFNHVLIIEIILRAKSFYTIFSSLFRIVIKENGFLLIFDIANFNLLTR